MNIKMFLKKISALLLAFSLALICFPMGYAHASENNAWMADLDDEMYLSEITIPGTHDSGSQYVDLGYVMRCQSTSVAEQLQNGYRYLDARVCIKEDKEGNQSLNVVHKFANCYVKGGLFQDKLKFSDVTSSIYDFLKSNPTETVILNVKIEDDDHSITQVQEFLDEEIKSNIDYWYTENSIPQLEEVRGKIVLMTRFDDEAQLDETGIQLQWEEQNNTSVVDVPYELYVTDACRLWVQDRYKYSVSDKYEAVIDGLENCEADENTIFLNFVSTSGSGKVGHPKGYAKQLNKLLMNYELQSQTSYGIVIVDFGTSELAEHIYMSNF